MINGTEPRGAQPGHSEPKAGPDWAQVGLVVLVALALIASVIMLVTDSAVALKIALLAALWAAVIGVLVGGRYRNQATQARMEMDLRGEAMQAEVRAAQQHAVQAQEQAQRSIEHARAQSAGQPSVADQQILQEIREELAQVRSQLEELHGRSIDFEPAALRAEARRIIELEAEAHRTSTETTQDVPVVDAEPEEPQEPPVVEPPADYSGVPSEDAIAGNIGSTPSRRSASNPLAQLINENKQREEEQEQEQEEAPSRGRRRREDHSEGISVAELLARAKKEERN